MSGRVWTFVVLLFSLEFTLAYGNDVIFYA